MMRGQEKENKDDFGFESIEPISTPRDIVISSV